jgi:ElaB/YqjD/DUF883 family membrane-anchored ribosome-binding protein
MNSSITNDFVKTSQAIADRAADKMQGVGRDAQHAAKEAGARLSTHVDELRSNAAPVLKKLADRTQSMRKQGMNVVSDAASQASDTIITYTKQNPAKALVIAAASGALLLALAKLLNPMRD